MASIDLVPTNVGDKDIDMISKSMFSILMVVVLAEFINNLLPNLLAVTSLSTLSTQDNGALVPLEVVPSGAASFVYENDPAGLPVYIGQAIPGTPKSEVGWSIMKNTYDVSGYLIAVGWADSDPGYSHIWDNRASYIYS